MSDSMTKVQLKQLKVKSSPNGRTGFFYRLDRFLRRFLPGYDYLRRKRSGSRISLDTRRVAPDTAISVSEIVVVPNAIVRRNQKPNEVYLDTGISKTDFCYHLDLLLRKKLLEQLKEQNAADMLLEGYQLEDALLVEKIDRNQQALSELAIQMRQMVPYQVEARHIEVRQMETCQVETCMETRQVETSQMETSQMETSQMETSQMETLQVAMTTLVVSHKESDEESFDQEAFDHEALDEMALEQMTSDQIMSDQMTSDQMMSYQMTSDQMISDQEKEKPMDFLRQKESLEEASQWKTTQLEKAQSETSQLKTNELEATQLEMNQFEANPIDSDDLEETSQENLRPAVARQNILIDEEQRNVGQKGDVETCQTEGVFQTKDVPMEIGDLNEFDLVEPYPSLDRIVEQAIEMARDQGGQNR